MTQFFNSRLIPSFKEDGLLLTILIHAITWATCSFIVMSKRTIDLVSLVTFEMKYFTVREMFAGSHNG